MVALLAICLLLLRVEPLLILRVSQRQQRHHVGFGQRRVASVRDCHLIDRTMQSQRDVVILYAGGGIQIDQRAGCARDW